MHVAETLFFVNLLVLIMDHVVCGFMGIWFPRSALTMYGKLFGIAIPPTQANIVLLKPWGALGLFAGIVTIPALLQPQRYVGVLFALAALLTIRLTVRCSNLGSAQRLFSLSRRRNWLHIGLIALCLVIIICQIVTLTSNYGS